MAKDFPKDEFDSVTAVGGRHRAKRTVRSRFASFLRYAALTLAISGVAIVGLNFSSSSTQIGDILNGAGNQAAGPAGFNAGGLGVTVIDSTDKKGLATKVGQSLFDAGWNVVSAVNLNLLGVTATTDNTTVVYATTSSAETAAKDLLKTLGSYTVQLSGAYADPITVVIGSDYK